MQTQQINKYKTTVDSRWQMRTIAQHPQNGGVGSWQANCPSYAGGFNSRPLTILGNCRRNLLCFC